MDHTSWTRTPASSMSAVGGVDLSGNRLLNGLPSLELERLGEAAERVRPRMREQLHAQNCPVGYAYFPQTGVFSQVAEMKDGGIVETLTIGSEGMIGLSALLGSSRSPTRAICQISGWAIRIPVAVLVDAAPRSGVLFDRLLRYAQVRLTSLSRSAACNRLHSARQRYARWVLTTHDRVKTDDFPITQEFLSQLLGVTRPTVSAVGQEFLASGLIHYAHGRITVDNRDGLNQVSCECYDTIRAAYDDLLGTDRG